MYGIERRDERRLAGLMGGFPGRSPAPGPARGRAGLAAVTADHYTTAVARAALLLLAGAWLGERTAGRRARAHERTMYTELKELRAQLAAARADLRAQRAQLDAAQRELAAEQERSARNARAAADLGELMHRMRGVAASLEVTAAVDGLTGVATRRRFDEALADEWRRAARLGSPLSLLLVDVDLFKAYNDHYGHQAGDECLRLIAEQLRASARRAGDLAARYGGEEFALLLPGADAAGAAAAAERVCNAVAALRLPHEASSVGPHVTVSIGVATRWPDYGKPVKRGDGLIGAGSLAIPAGTANVDGVADGAASTAAAALVTAADEALYLAKGEGRGRISIAP